MCSRIIFALYAFPLFRNSYPNYIIHVRFNSIKRPLLFLDSNERNAFYSKISCRYLGTFQYEFIEVFFFFRYFQSCLSDEFKIIINLHCANDADSHNVALQVILERSFKGEAISDKTNLPRISSEIIVFKEPPNY